MKSLKSDRYAVGTARLADDTGLVSRLGGAEPAVANVARVLGVVRVACAAIGHLEVNGSGDAGPKRRAADRAVRELWGKDWALDWSGGIYPELRSVVDGKFYQRLWLPLA
jgi:hypothetical protein